MTLSSIHNNISQPVSITYHSKLKIVLITIIVVISCSTVWITHTSLTRLSSNHNMKISYNSRDQQSSTQPLTASGKGFMMSLGFWEQQTQGLFSIRQLQHLANFFNMKVVQPFVDGSFLKLSFSPNSNYEDMPRMSDLIDIDVWNRELGRLYSYQPLATWESFLTKAPRNVTVHCIKYPLNNGALKPELNYQHDCPKECYKVFNNSLSYLSKFGFKLVKKTCSNFTGIGNSRITVEEFGENIFKDYNPANVTVIINNFRGVIAKQNSSRIPLIVTPGFDRKLPPSVIQPSKKIMGDAEKYISRQFAGRKYISIMVRTECLIGNPDPMVCVDKLMDVVTEMASKRKVEISAFQIFLAMDVGSFGSHGAVRKNLQPLGESVFKRVYKNNQTFEQWENLFAYIISIDNPAYVASLQRHLAAQGECLIMAGGGSFQWLTKNYYDTLHLESSRCVHSVCA